MTSALAINILSSLLAFLLGGAARALHQRSKAIGPARRVWRLGRRPEEVVLVQSDGPGHDTPFPTLYEGDAEAAVKVAGYLRAVCGVKSTRIIRASTFSRGRDARSDLVVVGGPSANDLYRRIDERVRPPYSFRLHKNGVAEVIRLTDGRIFAQEVVNARTVRDFAVISLLPSPFDAARRLVVLAGCGMTGTLAAAKMVTSDGIGEMARLRPPATPFSVVIEIEIIDGQMTRPSIVDSTHWSVAEPINVPVDRSRR